MILADASLIESLFTRLDKLERMIQGLKEPAQPPIQWLTAAQAAAELGVSTKTVTNWRNAGKLHGEKKPGSAWLYSYESVKELKR